MARGIRPAAAGIIIAIAALASFGGGQLLVMNAEKKYEAADQGMPETAVSEFISKAVSGDYTGFFANTQETDPSFNSQSAYEAKLAKVFDNVSASQIASVLKNDGDSEKDYMLYSGDILLGTLKLVSEGNTWKCAFPCTGTESYTIEVPAGMKISANGIEIGDEHRIESNVPASNFSQMYDDSYTPMVDLYQLDNLLGQPDIQANGEDGYSCVLDVLSKHLLLGRTVTDETALNTMIEDAKLIAQYPAQEAALSEVAAIADTNTSWYQRYTTLQNAWFTSHSTSSFTNQQTMNTLAQSEDSMVGYVTFDYFADNGEVSRTWHIGYQMTMVKENGAWKVAGMAIDNELNPASEATE
ncbi:MAG: hypothetical protein EOM64_08665 [Erysipelotrichia bacterium]|nr:hypothetical protein [Erysipelotrichia bacterium]